MIRSSVWGGRIVKDRISISSSFPILATIIALLGGMLAVFAPSIISNVLPALAATNVLAQSIWGFAIGAMIMAIIVILRQDEIAATLVIAVQLFIDSYLGFHVVSQVMALALLAIFFLARSPQRPWVEPRAIWLWFLFLTLTIYPSIRGALGLFDFLLYYPGIIVGGFLLFWLGTVIARNSTSIWRLFQILSAFGTLIAIHTFIQEMTGKFLFGTSHFDTFLADKSNYQLLSSVDVSRVGSFFVDPNWDGTFMAIMLSIALGLFFISPHFLGKLLYLTEMMIILSALLFTYSGGAWVAAIAGVVAFLVFAGRNLYRVLIPLFVVVAAIVVVVKFPLQFSLFIQHVTNPIEIRLRSGAWQTAWRVIQAYPLTGVGLGFVAYLMRAEPYRVPAQYVSLAHPHNSYLELGAMAGIPVLVVFVSLILFALWLALRNWLQVDVRTRTLIGAGIAAVVALSVNSWSINGWTLPPLAATGWLILGAISSPLISRELNCQMAEENNFN